MTIRTLIADDERLARDRLRLLLTQYSGVDVVSMCRNGRETLEAIRDNPVDLAFLDIQMPGMDGLQAAEFLRKAAAPLIVFVTAFENHALRAFELSAVDYLTKPVDQERLRSALDRAHHFLEAKRALSWRSEQERKSKLSDHLLVHEYRKELRVPIQRVNYIQAADYYSVVHTEQSSYLLRESLNSLSERLDPNVFMRVHRSTIVNIARVESLVRDQRVGARLQLQSGEVLKMSKAGLRLWKVGR